MARQTNMTSQRSPAPKAKRHPGWLGWTVRIAGSLILLFALAFAGFFAYFMLSVYPKLVAEHTAEAQRAQAFARLTGAARRLAIYDAFVEQIDKNYYDQSFSGFDWPEIKREWRSKAAAAPDDMTLYTSVFLQMAQLFPSSHVSANPPSVNATAIGATSAKPANPGQAGRLHGKLQFGGEKDLGLQIVEIRRGGGKGIIVGEVWHGSSAAAMGITPGWIIKKISFHIDPGPAVDQAHVSGEFLRLDPAQMHAFETTGMTRLVSGEDTSSAGAMKARIKALTVSINYDTKFGGPEADFDIKRLPDGILYIRFDNFDLSSLNKVAATLKEAGSRGVILDLRFNHGGYVMPLMEALLPGGTPVYKMRDAQGLHTIYTSEGAKPYAGPLAILTGPASASAAEVTTYAMKTNHRAIVVGRTTNGSVLGSKFFALPDGGQVQVPVEDIQTLDGDRLENIGVVPDIEIYPALEAIRAGRDQALEAAERVLEKKG